MAEHGGNLFLPMNDKLNLIFKDEEGDIHCEPKKGGEIKKGDLALLKGKPCRVRFLYPVQKLFTFFTRLSLNLFPKLESMDMLNVNSQEYMYSTEKRLKIFNLPLII